jgi:type II secretory pathway pseudopilin PulG
MTLVELLTVIGIIAVLAAILFPVFSKVKRKARQTQCISNLRQIGAAVQMYNEDYNGIYPYGVDPADKYAPEIWDRYPEWQRQLPTMPDVNDALAPYIRSRDLWRCPSDIGYDWLDIAYVPLDAQPTSFRKFGTSYVYRTELTFRGLAVDTLRRPAEVNMFMDGSGQWHGDRGDDLWKYWYCVVFCDGHAKMVNRSDYMNAWLEPLP